MLGPSCDTRQVPALRVAGRMTALGKCLPGQSVCGCLLRRQETRGLEGLTSEMESHGWPWCVPATSKPLLLLPRVEKTSQRPNTLCLLWYRTCWVFGGREPTILTETQAGSCRKKKTLLCAGNFIQMFLLNLRIYSHTWPFTYRFFVIVVHSWKN